MSRSRVVVFLLSLCILFLAGCTATLPDVSRLMEESSESVESPEIAGVRGRLPRRASDRILTRLERQAGPTDLLQANIVLMQSLSGHSLTTGNRATLLVDGPATYAAMSKAIAAARDHINLETFVFDDDDVGRRFAELLLQKQAEGVQVNLIYDSVGCKNTPAAFFGKLRAGGVKTLEFNPINPLQARRRDLITHRDHRKVVVIDGRTAFTGGVNISSVFSASPSRARPNDGETFGWRDTHVMIEGPAVAQFQELFLRTWRAQKGPPLTGRDYFPAARSEGKELITAVGSTPGDSKRLTYVMYVSAIKSARRFVHLTNAYFVPDEQMMEALTGAARRGVDVTLVLPGVSDSEPALLSGRSHYEDLLEAGVKLYERGDRMLHAKTAVIDGVWSTVGSTNFDLWSFLRNNEINAVILGVDFANQMEDLFQRDVAASKAITPKEWAERPLWVRLKELIARLASHWL